MPRTTKNLFFLILTICGWLSPSLAVAQTKIRLATLLPRGSSHYQVLESMGQQWRSASGNNISLTIYPDGTMGDEHDSVRRMRVGQIQAATLSVDGLSEIDPSVGALEKIPMVYRSLGEMEYVRSQMEPELERRLEAKGFVVLFWADTGWVHIFSRDPAMHPDDFKRTKVFVGASDIDEAGVVKSLGFQAVPLEWSDVLIGLQNKMVDTVPTAPFLSLAGQYDLVARHMLELPWVPLLGATVITRKAWDAIPSQDHEAFRQAALDAGKQMQLRGRQESLDAIDAMKKRGLQVHPVSPALMDEWQHFCEAAYPRMRGSMVPADMFDEVLRLVKQYRESGGGVKS
jgi:TRAP-type C4-dicarboxylate transport system substrate-binding protein